MISGICEMIFFWIIRLAQRHILLVAGKHIGFGKLFARNTAIIFYVKIGVSVNSGFDSSNFVAALVLKIPGLFTIFQVFSVTIKFVKWFFNIALPRA
jgi:hypothetical protein